MKMPWQQQDQVVDFSQPINVQTNEKTEPVYVNNQTVNQTVDSKQVQQPKPFDALLDKKIKVSFDIEMPIARDTMLDLLDFEKYLVEKCGAVVSTRKEICPR